MSRVWYTALVAAAVTLAWCVSSDVVAAPVDIKITTVQMRHQQMGVGIDRLAKYIQANLKDKVRVRRYAAAQLYTGQEEIQAVMKGAPLRHPHTEEWLLAGARLE